MLLFEASTTVICRNGNKSRGACVQEEPSSLKCPNDGLVRLALLKETHDLLWPFLHLPALSLSLFSCYETLQLKPRLPQFITGGTKAKALDKAGQTNSNQLPLNTHITPLSALLTYKWPIQDLFFCLFYLFFYNARGGRWRKCSGYTVRSQQVEDLTHLGISIYSPSRILISIANVLRGFQAIKHFHTIAMRLSWCNTQLFLKDFVPNTE